MKPDIKKIIQVLISLIEEQEDVEIEYTVEEKERDRLMAVEREDKHGRIKTDQYRADVACEGGTGSGAETSERTADKPAGDRDVVSDRRRDRDPG